MGTISFVINFNIPIVVVRQKDAVENRLDMMAIIGNDNIMLPVDADIEEGDQVERRLPNGKIQTFVITDVTVLESPFGGDLDHTEAKFTTPSKQSKPSHEGHTFNVHAANVQVATGDRSHQTMTIGQTADQLVLVIQGISELLSSLGLVKGRESELAEVQRDAVEDVTSDQPTASNVRRFYEWVLDCAKEGGTAAVVAAVTAASTALLTDAEALARAVGG